MTGQTVPCARSGRCEGSATEGGEPKRWLHKTAGERSASRPGTATGQRAIDRPGSSRQAAIILHSSGCGCVAPYHCSWFVNSGRRTVNTAEQALYEKQRTEKNRTVSLPSFIILQLKIVIFFMLCAANT